MNAHLRLLALTLAILGIAAIAPGTRAFALDAAPSSPDPQSIDGGGPNQPPDCSGAVASPASLWPRDRRYHLITIAGVTDPEGDPVTITAAIVTQDEADDPTSDACPDAILDGAGPVYVRAEGNSGGNGRVYRIKFVATDSHGASCPGTVEVCMPTGEGAPCSDDGQTVNSLHPCMGDNLGNTVPVVDECRCTGTVFVRGPGGELITETRTRFVTETGDTCAANSRIDIHWHAEPPIAVGYRYQLGEFSQWIEVGPEVTSVTYNSGTPPDTTPPAPGLKVFSLRAINQEFGVPDATRRFWLGMGPDTWFAGPDPDVSGGPWVTKPNGEKYALLVNGTIPPAGLPGTLLGPDSVAILPLLRTPRRTFLEIYGDTVFLRHEFDTVHKASWVVFHNGGFDADSPYRVKVADGIEDIMPDFPGGVVLTPAPANGSPVGFRTLTTVYLTPNGPINSTSLSRLYPFFDPNDFLHFPRIAAYTPMPKAGKAYAQQRAEDGHGIRDNRVDDARRVVETPVPELRHLVMVFEVDLPPELLTADPTFRPRVTAVDTFTSRIWNLRLPGIDPDPYASGDPLGGPSATQTLRLRFKVTGTDAQGAPVVFLDPAPAEVQQKYVNVTEVNLTVPATLASGPATLSVELCDCSFCEVNPGSGRCITRDIPVYYHAPGLFVTRAGSAVPLGGEPAATTSLATSLAGSAGGDVAIRFDLAVAGIAALDIYNVTGQRVRRLTSAWLPAGRQTSAWDRRDQQGREVSPGIYFVHLRAPDATLTRKFFVAR